MDLDELKDVELMPLDTPILKVSRPVAACTRCRLAKIKCDGRLPACTSCERSGRAADCTSTNDQFAKGKERSYVSTLETRIEKLQEKLDEARRRKPSVISIPDDETMIATRRPSMEPDYVPPTGNGATRAQRRQENHAIDDLVSDFGFLSVHATARDFFGFTQAMTYSRLIIWASCRDPLPEGISKALPARHVTTRLLQHFLSSMHQLVPFIDEASLYGCVNNVYSYDNRAEPFDHWMVRMVLAVANASMSERSGDQNYLDGIGHVCAALEHAEAVLHPGAISSVQALILLSEYALLDPHHFDAWTLIGAASRAMADLGLHQDPPKGATMSKGKLETRRRIFWAVYVLDRSTSLVQSRAFSFSDDSAKVKSAFNKQPGSSATSPQESTDAKRSWLQSNDQALDLISLRQLQSAWYTDLFQSGRSHWEEPYPFIWKTCEDMKKWYEKLSSATPTYMRAYFELELLYSYIYVLAPSPRVQTIVPYAQTLIFEYCIRYADNLFQLLNNPEQKLAPITFTDAMRAYMIGRFFLDILQQNTEGLLSGAIPPLPGVPPSAAPPPSMPEVNYPPTTDPQYHNTVRALNCIKTLTESLSRFGLRWGYLSWSQHYAAATAPMIEQLTQRQRDYEALANARRGSVWTPGSHVSHHSSVSSMGSISVGRSPHNSIGSQQFLGAVSPGVQALSSYISTPPPPSISPPQLSPPAQLSPPIGYQPQLWQQGTPGLYQTPSNASMSPPAQQLDMPTFSFADPSVGYTQTTAFSTAPQSQFSHWQGYSGAVVANTLDEENAAAPPNMPMNMLHTDHHGPI